MTKIYISLSDGNQQLIVDGNPRLLRELVLLLVALGRESNKQDKANDDNPTGIDTPLN